MNVRTVAMRAIQRTESQNLPDIGNGRLSTTLDGARAVGGIDPVVSGGAEREAYGLA
jgi:hypothetical protein